MHGEVVLNIARLAEDKTSEHMFGGEKLLVHNGSIIERKLIQHPTPKTLVVHTLTGLVGYVHENLDELDSEDVVVHVVSPTRVELVSRFDEDTAQRHVYVAAECYDRFEAVRGFQFGVFLQHEPMVIALHALFLPTDDRARLLDILMNVEQGAVRTDTDDGVSQAVTVRTGISLAGERRVPNPVTLRPYRSFAEVDQPESLFVFRMKQSQDAQQAGVALFEADGGEWRDTVTASIRAWLADGLAETGVAVLA